MKYSVANWKLNMNINDVREWTESWNAEIAEFTNTSVIVAPSFVHLQLASDINNAVICAQDVSISEKGAHTGDVGAFQLEDFAKYCIVGHSERTENKDVVLAKAQKCIESGITPIICFTDVNDFDSYIIEGALLAWEDPKNISKNGEYREKDPEEIRIEVEKIRLKLDESKKLLYGGSVNKDNIQNIAKIDGIDGVLVGNASLDPKHFIEICKELEK